MEKTILSEKFFFFKIKLNLVVLKDDKSILIMYIALIVYGKIQKIKKHNFYEKKKYENFRQKNNITTPQPNDFYELLEILGHLPLRHLPRCLTFYLYQCYTAYKQQQQQQQGLF